MQDGAAVTGLIIAGASLVAVNRTGNAIYDPIGSIIVGNLLGMVHNHISSIKMFHCVIGYCMMSHRDLPHQFDVMYWFLSEK